MEGERGRGGEEGRRERRRGGLLATTRQARNFRNGRQTGVVDRSRGLVEMWARGMMREVTGTGCEFPGPVL